MKKAGKFEMMNCFEILMKNLTEKRKKIDGTL